jgi:hypothetical protein
MYARSLQNPYGIFVYLFQTTAALVVCRIPVDVGPARGDLPYKEARIPRRAGTFFPANERLLRGGKPVIP